MNDNILGKRLKVLRSELEITQEEFGKRYNLKKSTISQYESGVSRPDDELKTRIATDYNVSIDWLLGLTDIRTPLDNADQVSNALADDPELNEFWEKLKERESLQIMFKQVKNLDDKSINQVMRIIKAIEDEENKED